MKLYGKKTFIGRGKVNKQVAKINKRKQSDVLRTALSFPGNIYYLTHQAWLLNRHTRKSTNNLLLSGWVFLGV